MGQSLSDSTPLTHTQSRGTCFLPALGVETCPRPPSREFFFPVSGVGRWVLASKSLTRDFSEQLVTRTSHLPAAVAELLVWKPGDAGDRLPQCGMGRVEKEATRGKHVEERERHRFSITSPGHLPLATPEVKSVSGLFLLVAQVRMTWVPVPPNKVPAHIDEQ